MKTFKIRVTNTKDKNYLKNYIYKYRYWQNILTIDVSDIQRHSNALKTRQEKSTCITKKSLYSGKRTKRGLFKDTTINKINADLNDTVNHIKKLTINKNFQRLKDNRSFVIQ